MQGTGEKAASMGGSPGGRYASPARALAHVWHTCGRQGMRGVCVWSSRALAWLFLGCSVTSVFISLYFTLLSTLAFVEHRL